MTTSSSKTQTSTTPESQENTTVNDALATLQAAQNAADAAVAHAAQLKADADAAEAEQEAKALAEQIAREIKQRETFREDHVTPLKGFRENFETAVLAGKTGIPEWSDYMAHVRIAAGTDARLTMAAYRRDMDKFEALQAQVQSWNEEVEHARQTRNVGVPKTAGNYGGWWTPHVQGLSEAQLRNQGTMKSRLHQINTHAESVAKEYGVTLGRADDDTTPIQTADILAYPKSPSMSIRETTRFERRTYRQAVDEVIEQAITTRATELAKAQQ